MRAIPLQLIPLKASVTPVDRCATKGAGGHVARLDHQAARNRTQFLKFRPAEA